MSVSKKHLADPILRSNVVSTYCQGMMTMEQVAEKLQIGHHTVCAILKEDLAPGEFKELKAIKYSHSKENVRNPMWRKVPSNYIGECNDGYGYKTRLSEGKRRFVHRMVFADLLGISIDQLPEELCVHHIDENTNNNAPNNLALTTRGGHRRIHLRYK